ncbi:MAG: hypothetical protein U0822_12830 [Anaerolineae bacterium]
MATRLVALIMGIAVVGLMVLVVGQGTGQKIGADATPIATDAAVVYIPLIRQQATLDPDAWRHTPTPAGKPVIATSVLGPADVWGVDGQTVWRWDGDAWRAQTQIQDAILIAMNSDVNGWVVARHPGMGGVGPVCGMDVWHWQNGTWTPIDHIPRPICGLTTIKSYGTIDITLHGYDGWYDGRRESYIETEERWDGQYWNLLVPLP